MLAQNIVLLWERYILTGVIRHLYVFHDEGPYHKKNQSMDFLCKSINWFLYERDHHHESVTYTVWTVSVFGVFLVRLFGIFLVRIYIADLCIHSDCGKILTRKTPNMDTFYAVLLTKKEVN